MDGKQMVTGNYLKCLLIFPLILFSGGCGGNETSDSEFLQRAKNLLDQKDLKGSQIELKNALQQNPENVEARTLLGLNYLEFGDGASAEKELRRAFDFGVAEAVISLPLAKSQFLQRKWEALLEEFPVTSSMSPSSQAELYAMRGKARLARGNMEGAEAEYRSSIEIKPDSVHAMLGQASLSVASRDLESARTWIDRSLERAPQSAEAWNASGNLYRTRGEKAKAEEAYSKAISLRLNNHQNYLDRAIIRIDLARYEEAQSDLDFLAKLSQRHPGVAYGKGLIHLRNERYTEAIEEFENSRSFGGSAPETMFYLGVAHLAKGQLEQADQFLSRFLNSYPRSESALKLSGVVHFYLGDYLGAESLIRPLLRKNQDDPALLELMGSIALKQGNVLEGAEHLMKLIVIQPENAKAHIQLGIGLLATGDREQGIKLLEKAIEIDSNLYIGDANLIVSHLQAKEYAEAREAAKRWLDKAPDRVLAQNFVALAAYGFGEEANAREAFDQVLEMAPGNPTAALNLAAIALKDNDAEKARLLFEQVLDRHPGHLNALLKFAAMEYQQGNIAKGETLLKQAIDGNPDALEPRFQLSRYYLTIGQTQRALELAQGAPRAQQDHPSLLAIIGQAQLSLKQHARAAETLRRLVKAKPDWDRAHFLLANAYSGTKDLNRLREELEATLRLNPGHLLAKTSMLRLVAMDDKSAARDLVKDLKRDYPNNPEVLAQEAWLAMLDNRPNDAVKAYRDALKEHSSSKLTMGLAIAQSKAGDLDGTLETLTAWVEGHPDDLVVLNQLANTYLSTGQNIEARNAFAGLVERAPTEVVALNNLAWLFREEDPARAMGYGERAMKLAPHIPNVLDTMGMLLLDQGEIDQALSLFRKATGKNANNPTMLYHLALALSKKKENAEALQVLAKALKHKKPFAERDEAERLLEEIQ